jgi:hypothetical protein
LLRHRATAAPPESTGWIDPRGRPAGFPDCPFANGRPRTLLAVVVVFCTEISVIAPPRSGTLAPAVGCPLETDSM